MREAISGGDCSSEAGGGESDAYAVYSFDTSLGASEGSPDDSRGTLSSALGTDDSAR